MSEDRVFAPIVEEKNVFFSLFFTRLALTFPSGKLGCGSEKEKRKMSFSPSFSLALH